MLPVVTQCNYKYLQQNACKNIDSLNYVDIYRHISWYIKISKFDVTSELILKDTYFCTCDGNILLYMQINHMPGYK